MEISCPVNKTIHMCERKNDKCRTNTFRSMSVILAANEAFEGPTTGTIVFYEAFEGTKRNANPGVSQSVSQLFTQKTLVFYEDFKGPTIVLKGQRFPSVQLFDSRNSISHVNSWITVNSDKICFPRWPRGQQSERDHRK